jgi:hypothetical protein
MPFGTRFFRKKPTHYQKLRSKWSKKHAAAKKTLWTKHKNSLDWLVQNIPAKQQLVAGSLSSLLLLAPPTSASLPAPTQPAPKQEYMDIPEQTFFLADLHKVVPTDVRPLTPPEEQTIAQMLSKYTGFKVSAELNGKRLNTTYGIIGAEQHLARFPGDTMATHFATADEAASYTASGMAPGRGAWGYFVPDGAQMTQKDSDREKYYIAVQTFLAPGFASNVRDYYNFFRFRKMLVVNPENGKAIVADIGDAGPAVWTGKQLGGSPEVMSYLDRHDGAARGPVLYFFIDDPNDTIPLGPVAL